MSHTDAVHGKLALDFATALVSGQFEDASALLSSTARADWSATVLRDAYQEMIEYFDAPPDAVEVMETMTDWPDKQDGDIGWAYVAIEGDDGSEAVTVVVCAEGDRHLIREIEWGRP